MKIVSLFSGIGGIDLALCQLGHDVIWANENDRYAVKTYKRNFPHSKIIEEDVKKIDMSSLPNFDILTAGFPCQPFSVMGYQKGFEDSRGYLFFEIIKIVKFKNPRIIFLENVKNLIKHDNGNTFLRIQSVLSELGYYIKYKVMSPHEYVNIPQIRDRIFIIAFRDKVLYDGFQFPESLRLTRKINDLIDRNKLQNEIFYYREDNKYYKLLNERIKDKNAIYRIDDWGVAEKKWNICPTLKANMGTYSNRVPIIRDDYGLRKITPYECLKFQGFPNDYVLADIPLNEAYKQCGNTVCVSLVYTILRNLNKII